MKKFMPSLLLVVFLGGLWYAWSQDFFKEQQPLEQAKALVQVNVQEVQSFSIENKDQPVIELIRNDDGWSMARPSAAPLNPNLTEGWIDSFNLLTQERAVDEHASDLAKFGLAEPSSVYRVSLSDGTTKEVRIGSATPVEGYVYVQLNDSPAVYQVNESSITALNKRPLDFVETNPVKFDYDRVKSISFNWKNRKWDLVKNEGDKPSAESKWKMGGKEIEGAEAVQMLERVRSMDTEQMPKPALEAAVKAVDWTMEIVETIDGKDLKSTYEARPDEQAAWVIRQGGEWAYAIPASFAEELADLGAPKSEGSGG
ncbi:DUF4340 domain-containing protein [Paenibacillus sp. FJAT-26967]|uniref:DUF4340 domain-containing protein n=1 Tax=Paenibacillus sp. FJAT-26967 TaxID=1729690 RepID=UPI000838B5FE|nr:DUF4340 domain-containing protein [Paenibacillus sp. FJAT-26967]